MNNSDKFLKRNLSQILKDDVNSRLTGLASSVLREKMISLILSDNFPSVEHCNIYQQEKKDEEMEASEDTELIAPNCPNICCTGAFVQEGMMGVIMSAEVGVVLLVKRGLILNTVQVRQLIFTSDKVQSRRQFPACLEFNVPVVLTHLLGATDGKVSQLERLVFSENFVKEEAEEGAGGHSRAKLPCLDQSDKQATFSKHFGQVRR